MKYQITGNLELIKSETGMTKEEAIERVNSILEYNEITIKELESKRTHLHDLRVLIESDGCEEMLCGRRSGMPSNFKLSEHDYWRQIGEDRCCSFCGSMHPEDFMKHCEDAVKDGSSVMIERTDKSYKYYIHRDDVKNAGDGGIKFYMHHAPQNEEEDNKNWNGTFLKRLCEACKVSDKKFKKRFLS